MTRSATAQGRLLLTFLGGIAEFERDLIGARTSEGRARAKSRGVHMGRPPRSRLTSARKPCATSPRARRCRPTLRGGSMCRGAQFHDLLLNRGKTPDQRDELILRAVQRGILSRQT
ncbi:recombinase family protein [Methylocystis sp. 9N]|uniref:Recombinase family protein n=1 Tax=Methylocystis borbori TaxID=3118750 RepID=A0ABU7XEX0_9HYPH